MYARGGVRFYGSENAAARGMATRPGTRHPRRSAHPVGTGPAQRPRLRALYYDNESYDGYRRDQDVFGPGVTTEDNLAVIVDYAARTRR